MIRIMLLKSLSKIWLAWSLFLLIFIAVLHSGCKNVPEVSTSCFNREGLCVDVGKRLGEISPYVYGTNFGPWMVVPFELMDEAEIAGITYLRFPGGNWGDQNDLMPYQIDQFINLARRLGAEPSISVRLRGARWTKQGSLSVTQMWKRDTTSDSGA